MNFFGSSKTLEDLDVHFNPDGWGPVSGEKLLAFDEVPYAHFDKKDRCNRAADFTGSQHYQQKYQRYRHGDMNQEFAYRHDAAEDSTFQLVDSTKATTKKFSGMKKGFQQNRPGGGRGGRGQGNARDSYATGGRGAAGRGGRGAGRGGRGRGGRGFRRDRKDRVPSLTVEADWELVEEFDLGALLKLVANPPKVEDLTWCGHLDQYDEVYDKVTTRNAKPLKRVENKIFYAVTTEDDPVIDRFAAEGLGNVFATDTILAQLMAAPRSLYSWDIVIQKVNDMIFLDKREGSAFDLLTVSETSRDPPTTDDPNEINQPMKLSLEATMINQNFSQQVLKDHKDDAALRKAYEPNPFFEEEDDKTEPASGAYRYRKFTLGNVTLVARCELHCWMRKREEEVMMTCYALNEWDSKYSDGVNWRQKIDTQRGAVLATELKNNSCKLAKWTAQSIIAGADQMKIGYVSRVAPTNPYDHVTLATGTFKPKELATQINLSLNNIWGIIKMISELLMAKEDGKFVLLKDPNKSTLRLYEVPLGTFEDEEEGGEEEAANRDDDA